MRARAIRDGSIFIPTCALPKACEWRGLRILTVAEVSLGRLRAPGLIIWELFCRILQGGVIWTTALRVEGGVSLPALSADNRNQSPAVEGSP